MSKSRKRWRVALAVLCLVAVLFSVFWFVPYLRLRVLRVPVESDLFLLPPDKVTVTYQGETFELDAVQSARMYRLLDSAISKASIDIEPSVEDKAKDQKWSFEFHYDYRYYYTGKQYVGTTLFEHRFVFDTLSFGIMDDGKMIHPTVLINPSVFGVEYKIGGESRSLACESAYIYDAVMCAYIEQILHMPGKGDVDIFDSRSSDVFPALPDEIVISQKGEVKTLTGAELQAVYDVFMAMLRGEITRLSPTACEFESTRGILLNSICLEFRYQNRQYYNDVYHSNPQSQYVTYRTNQYDAVLFALLPYYEDTVLARADYYKEAYEWEAMGSEICSFESQKMNALLDVIRAVQ